MALLNKRRGNGYALSRNLNSPACLDRKLHAAWA